MILVTFSCHSAVFLAYLPPIHIYNSNKFSQVTYRMCVRVHMCTYACVHSCAYVLREKWGGQSNWLEHFKLGSGFRRKNWKEISRGWFWFSVKGKFSNSQNCQNGICASIGDKLPICGNIQIEAEYERCCGGNSDIEGVWGCGSDSMISRIPPQF